MGADVRNLKSLVVFAYVPVNFLPSHAAASMCNVIQPLFSDCLGRVLASSLESLAN